MRSSTRRGGRRWGRREGMPSGTIFSIAARTTCGPSEQLTPMTLAPHAPEALAHLRHGGAVGHACAPRPPRPARRPARRARPRRHALQGQLISSRLAHRLDHEHVDAALGQRAACSRKASRTRTRSSSEKPAKYEPRRPDGARDVRALAGDLAGEPRPGHVQLAHASSSPCRARQTRLAPKVLVSSTCAPARAVVLVDLATTSGRETSAPRSSR